VLNFLLFVFMFFLLVTNLFLWLFLVVNGSKSYFISFVGGANIDFSFFLVTFGIMSILEIYMIFFSRN